MTQLVIRGNLTQIVGETDSQHLLALDKHLSFFVQGAEHTAAFKGYVNHRGDYVKWDGFKKLLSAKLTFPTGLVERVKDFYLEACKEVEIVDMRPAKSIAKPKDILGKLVSLGKTPYQYQLDVLDVIDKHDRGIIKVATGGGKSLIAALMTAKLGRKTIIYVIGKDLLYQFHEFFEQVFDEKIGIIGDGRCEIEDINIASVWTIGQAVGIKKQDILLDNDEEESELAETKYDRIRELVKQTKVHIFDECHMCAADTFQQIFKDAHMEFIYGLSGSPWRDDNADLLVEGMLGKYIVNISASELIGKGYLAQPIIRFKVVPPPATPLEKNYKHIYKHYIVENEVRNNLVLEAAGVLVNKGYQTLVLFSSIKHGKILYNLLSQHIKCALLDGSNDKETRAQVKQDLLDHKIDCIIASRIFDIGVDIPSLSGLVIASGGKSTVKALQRVGRVIRRYEGKTHAAIVDFYDDAPFLDNHTRLRYNIYKSEEGFNTQWPKIEKQRKSKKQAAN